MKQGIGDRMKQNYEKAFNFYLPWRMPIIIRVDGKNFHSFTRKMERPFDARFMDEMQQLTLYLCKEVHTTVFAYSQSDEISLLLHPYKKLDSQPYFLNEVQKISSIVAGTASSYFSRAFDKEAIFDSRCFVVPAKDEVCNYFVWRQQDATRNSINMVGQSKFSHKQLQGKNTKQVQEMMFQKDGTNWNDFETYKKRGFAVYKQPLAKKVNIPKQGETLIQVQEWQIDFDIPIFSKDKEFIEKWLKVEEE